MIQRQLPFTSPNLSRTRRLPIGAELQSEGVHFRLWAPRRREVSVLINDGQATHPLTAEGDGYFSGLVPGLQVGARYQFQLDDLSFRVPDPASRFQPDGPHGASEVIDPTAFAWTDHDWPGIRIKGQVIYELHLGTFSPTGGWAGAIERLAHLKDIGVTVVEVMPVSEFPGEFGWGYDGVNLFAPTRLYGQPDEFRQFVNRAHELGLAVILDIVYNHFGPDGNYLREFSEEYFSSRYTTPWGDAINFDGPGSAAVREFFLANVQHWVQEYHLDGFRIDATQDIFDSTRPHILAEMSRVARVAAGERGVILVAENELQQAHLVHTVEKDGYGLDGLWNDDYHHTALVALTGRNEAYFMDYQGAPQEFISALKWGYLYQGQWYRFHKRRRGSSTLNVEPAAFVTFLENHDQVANTGRGQRIHQVAGLSQYRALTVLTLLAPGTPMLFQGQEFASSRPFLYFADHNPTMAELVRKGRKESLKIFPSLAQPEMQAIIDDPESRETFERCKLDWSECEKNEAILNLHRDVLKLRREDPVFSAQKYRGVDGAVLSADAFVIRYFGEDGDDRLIIVNLGRDFHCDPAPEPLLAPPSPDQAWKIYLTSEHPRYGGNGIANPDTDDNWHITGHAATVMLPRRASEETLNAMSQQRGSVR